MRWNYLDLIGKSCDIVSWLLRMQIRVTGREHFVDQPTIYVPNHFTRLETSLIPYVLLKHRGQMPHTLGMHGLLEGPGARFLRSVGVISVKHPQRNRMIIRHLMTNSNDWIIYAEGGLIKNKKTVRNGRLYLDHPSHQGPPHTGAAMLALKAEISRQRYLQACVDEDMLRREFYENEFDVRHPKQISERPVVVQPVSITFHPMRAGDTIVSRLAAKLAKNMNAKLLEEIAFESSLLLKRASIDIHFGKAIAADQYLDLPRQVVRRLMARFAEHRHADVMLRRQARRYTSDVMQSVYTGVEVNIDHLLAMALRERADQTISRTDLRAALLLAARSIDANKQVRVHLDLRDNVNRIVTTNDFEPLRRAMHLAQDQGIVRLDGSTIVINGDKLNEMTPFDSIRLTNTVQVLANELEPNRPAIAAIRDVINLPSAELQRRVARLLHDDNVMTFDHEYRRWYRAGASKPADHGQPYLQEHRSATTGIVLVHGYLSTPQQMRPLADFLHAKGYSVYSVRLPSHGTAPDHLSEAAWPQWIESVRHGYCLMQHSCTNVIVGGISLGGVLALLLAASEDIQPAGVFAINPPFQLRDRRARFVPTVLRWQRALAMVGMRRAAQRLISSNTETPEMSYAHHPVVSIQEVRRAAAVCQRRLERITAPMLLVQGDRDPVVSPQATQKALREAGSDLRLLTMLAFDRHNIVCGERKELVFQTLNRFLIRIGAGSAAGGAVTRPRWRHRLIPAARFLRMSGLGQR